jgi:RimJ/RimL family protein N-acetyltransferase
LGAEAPRIEFPAIGISDGRIRLRMQAESDVPAMVAACQDPEIFRFTRVPEPYTEHEAVQWQGEAARQHRDSSGLHLLIVDEEGGDLLGSVGFVTASWPDRWCELGYWVAREARGRGVATAAVRLLCGWLFEELPIDKISIVADVENAPSRAVAERSGFTYEGVLRSHALINDVRRDMASYGLLSGELT